MNIDTRGNDLFFEYYARWITVYKKGAIRKVTLDKYLMAQKWLEKLIPTLRVCDMNRIAYQQLLNDYAECHERQTTMDFHHQLKGAILDAVDEGLIDRDPTRKAIIKGRTPTAKKGKEPLINHRYFITTDKPVHENRLFRVLSESDLAL